MHPPPSPPPRTSTNAITYCCLPEPVYTIHLLSSLKRTCQNLFDSYIHTLPFSSTSDFKACSGAQRPARDESPCGPRSPTATATISEPVSREFAYHIRLTGKMNKSIPPPVESASIEYPLKLKIRHKTQHVNAKHLQFQCIISGLFCGPSPLYL